MEESGIYCISNTITGHKYIGSSIQIDRRKIVHFSELKRNKHINPYLQNAFNKYGKGNFSFEVLEIVKQPDTLLSREQYWIELLETTKRNKGFNIQEIAGRTTPWLYKKHHTEESKQKSSIANRGQKRSNETKEKLRQAHIGKTQSEETKEKRRNLMKGNTFRKGKPSPMRGKKLTQETIRKRTVSRQLRREARDNGSSISLP